MQRRKEEEEEEGGGGVAEVLTCWSTVAFRMKKY